MSSLAAARRVGSPYQAGDAIKLIHQTDTGIHAADVTVEACVALGDGRWRVEAHRELNGAPEVDIVVRADGYDDHGLIIPAVLA